VGMLGCGLGETPIGVTRRVGVGMGGNLGTGGTGRGLGFGGIVGTLITDGKTGMLGIGGTTGGIRIDGIGCRFNVGMLSGFV